MNLKKDPMLKCKISLLFRKQKWTKVNFKDLNSIPEKPGIYVVTIESDRLKNLYLCSLKLYKEFRKENYPFPEALIFGYEYIPVYVGISKNLKDRLKTHIKGTSRSSTFRKTTGCLLCLDRIYLEDNKYEFKNENLLTEFIKDNFRFFYLEIDSLNIDNDTDILEKINGNLIGNLEYIEDLLINFFETPFNLDKVRYDRFKEVKEKIKACRQ